MLKLVVVALLVAGSQAMVQCPQNACALVDCMMLDASTCDGKVVQGGGYCGCCDACVTQLAEGADCHHLLLLGIPATAECASGLYCNPSTLKCDAMPVQAEGTDMGACLRRKQEIAAAKTNDLPLIGVSEPMCDANGAFEPVQCFGSVCNCVTKAGVQIEGYSSEIGLIGQMDCQCAIDQHEYMASGMIGKLFYCDSNGNYKTTDAPAVAVTTAAPSGTLLGSGSGAVTGDGACAKELASAQTSSLLGVFIPECDIDGNYIPRQCQGSECYCVRKDGSKIEGYSAPIATKDHVTCQCARDKDNYESQGMLGRIHTCRANGSYQQYQCLGSVCYCTDDLGNKLSDQSVSIGNINDLNCA